MADTAYARYTTAILEMLPHWFHIRKHSRQSVGARFLNISGLKLDDARYVLDYAYDQCYINTMDIDQIDFCYKSILPITIDLSKLTSVKAHEEFLHEAQTIKEFYGVNQNGIKDETLFSYSSYFLDKRRNIIYVRRDYNADATNVNGKITLIFNNEDKKTFPLIPHQVWNYFDEMGAFVGCKRIFKESNQEYKERILDVFKNPSNASRDGLINGIGRELALRREIIWADPHRDIELKDSMVVLNSIKVNGNYIIKVKNNDEIKKNDDEIKMPDIYISDTGNVLIKGYDDEEYRHDYVISYVHGLEMHQMHNRNDIKLYNELYTVEDKPKKKLLNYIDRTEADSPLFWNNFHWNEHYWDQNDPEDMEQQKQVSYIPNLYDPSIRGLEKYGVYKQKIPPSYDPIIYIQIPYVVGDRTYNGSVQSPEIVYDSRYLKMSGDTTGKNTGEYTLSFKIDTDKNVKWIGDYDNDYEPEVTWEIKKAKLAVPSTDNNEFVYDRQYHSPVLNNFYPEIMDKDGFIEEVEADISGRYKIGFTLKDTTNYEWIDGTTLKKFLTWYIKKSNYGSLVQEVEGIDYILCVPDSEKVKINGTAKGVGTITITITAPDDAYISITSNGTITKDIDNSYNDVHIYKANIDTWGTDDFVYQITIGYTYQILPIEDETHPKWIVHTSIMQDASDYDPFEIHYDTTLQQVLGE